MMKRGMISLRNGMVKCSKGPVAKPNSMDGRVHVFRFALWAVYTGCKYCCLNALCRMEDGVFNTEYKYEHLLR